MRACFFFERCLPKVRGVDDAAELLAAAAEVEGVSDVEEEDDVHGVTAQAEVEVKTGRVRYACSWASRTVQRVAEVELVLIGRGLLCITFKFTEGADVVIQATLAKLLISRPP